MLAIDEKYHLRRKRPPACVILWLMKAHNNLEAPIPVFSSHATRFRTLSSSHCPSLMIGVAGGQCLWGEAQHVEMPFIARW